MPPRHSKSVHVSQLFPAFVVGKDKNKSVIVSSYSGDLATDQGRETRNIIESQAYKNVFDTKLAEDSNAKGKWNTDGKGAYNAVGVGGSVTGKGADYFIVDDPFKDRKEADSPIIREDRWKWVKSVARTRLTPTGALIIMHTRWHDDDIIGRFTVNKQTKEDWVDYFDFLKGARAKWVRLKLPAIAENDEVYRKKGEALWPQRYPLSELLDIKRTLGSYEWSALYQQSPIDEVSQEFRKELFIPISREKVESTRTRKFATIDTALSKREESDYTGVCRNYVDIENNWNISASRHKLSSKEIIDYIFKLHNDGFEKIGIEEGAFTLAVKPFLEDEMKKRNKFPLVVPLKHNQTQKETRIRGLIPRYEAKSIRHIIGECDDLEEELLRFPKAANDDVSDATAYQLQIAEAAFPESDGSDFGLYQSSFG